MIESFYSEFWSGYLFSNFPKVGGSQKVQTKLLQLLLEVKNLVGS